MDRGGRWTGGHFSVGWLWSDHLSAWDRALKEDVHIGAAKCGLKLLLFWAQCVYLADT
jgi:hypothetical protein